jgi:predicted metal-dependent hydrolase/CheY-like chemotaxis protein
MIMITGCPAWGDHVAELLRSGEFEPVTCPESAAYLDQLVDEHAALILVDGDDPHWRYWAITPKTRQPTRRIPILIVTDQDDIRRTAISAGVDGSLSPADLDADLIGLIRDLARIPDPAVVEQIACDCELELPPRARLGIEKFNAGEYYAQHDLLEAQWMAEIRPIRDLYRAILQVGVAYYHITRGNYRGAHKMLLRSVQWLAILPDVCQGVDIRQLREDSAQVRAALETLPDGASFDLTLLRPVRLVAD